MSVTTTNPEYDKVSPDWQKIDDALDGADTVKDKGETYLKKPFGMMIAEKETGEKLYDAYKFRAQYPLWVKDGVRSSMGLFARAKIVLEMPKPLMYLQDKATADGQGIEVLFLRLCRDLLTKGRAPRVLDIDDSMQFYIASYSAENAINWKSQVVNGRKVLTLAVFKETVAAEDNDEFGHETSEQYRIYRLRDQGATVEVVKDDGTPIKDEAPLLFNNKAITFLPIIYAGATDNDPEPDEVPLLQMALAALNFYSVSADYYQQLHEAAHQQRYIVGVDGDQAPKFSGPNGVWLLPPESSAGVLNSDVKGMEERAKDMERQRNIAIEAGAKVMDVSAAESGDARRARQDDQHATLAIIARMAAEAVEQLLGYAAQLSVWGGSQTDAILEQVSFTSTVDFGTHEVDPQVLRELREGWMAGTVSASTYWQYYLTGKQPDREDYADEQELIQAGM